MGATPVFHKEIETTLVSLSEMQKIRLIIKKKNAKTSKTLFLFLKKNALIKKKKAFVLIDVCVYYLHHGFQISMFGHVGWMGPSMNWL